LTLRLIYETIGPSEPRLELAIANERCVTRPFGVQQHARSVVKAIELNTFDGVANIGEAASNPRLVGCGSVTHALDYTTKRSRSSVWGNSLIRQVYHFISQLGGVPQYVPKPTGGISQYVKRCGCRWTPVAEQIASRFPKHLR
jgi:hypothetical protein